MENKIDLLENIKSEISWCSESINSDADAYGYEQDALSFLNNEMNGFMSDSHPSSNDMNLEDAAGYDNVQEILSNCAPPLLDYFTRFKSKFFVFGLSVKLN